MPATLTGKVALVTGGASGIGRATALTFAREGAKLIIADMHEEGGQQTVHMITENGGEATFVQVDVSNATQVAAMISKSVVTYGRLDCAHNNAGISGACLSGDLRVLTAAYPEERWQQVLGARRMTPHPARTPLAWGRSRRRMGRPSPGVPSWAPF